MNPKFKGAASEWKRTQGMRVGTDETTGADWVEVPFEGPSSKTRAFRKQFNPGDSCPVSGFTQLKLRSRPTVIEKGPVGYATLRFEGPSEDDGDGGGGDSEREVTESAERHTIEIATSNDTEGTGLYSYNAPTLWVRYTARGRKGSAAYASLMGRLEDPEPLRKESGGSKAPPAEELSSDDYKTVKSSSLVEQVERGGVWEITEHHAIYLEPSSGND